MDNMDMKILLTLEECDRNICAVARKLFMHQNTVRYHISKIRDITGKNPMKPDDLHELITTTPIVVVRCKDCKFHNNCKFEQYQGLDGFCSLGEWKVM